MAVKAGDRHLWCRKSKDARWVRVGHMRASGKPIFRCSGCGKHKTGKA